MATKQTKHSRLTIGGHFFEKQDFQFEKQKQFLVRFEPTTFAVPGVFVTTRLNVQETLKFFTKMKFFTKFELFMNQDTSDSVKQVVNTEKICIPV